MCTILIVDDEPSVREVMARWAERLGHEVRQAASAEEALEIMAEWPADVVVCDVAMPGRDGVWLARQLRDAYPETAIIMETSSQDVEVALSSLRQGAVDFLGKPFGYDLFREALGRGIHWHRDARNARDRLETLQQEVRDHLSHLEAIFLGTPVESDADLERILETLIPDRAALEHARRVAALVANMAVSMGIRSPELAEIQRAALLHDVGRVAIPPAILCKPAPLSNEEIAIVRQQPRLVSEILARHAFLAPAAAIVRVIFERIDGSGYPWALRGDEIPRGARIIAVADALDAMTHYRVHRETRTPAEAIFEIQRCRGTQFDPDAVDALLNVAHLHWTSVARRVAVEPGSSDYVVERPIDLHTELRSVGALLATNVKRTGLRLLDPGVGGSAEPAPLADTVCG